MSDPIRATLITVGAPKSAKDSVSKTVRLTINLDESNESKYPELNYKELVNAEERKKCVQNGKPLGLDPFSDNDEDVERAAKKFEQKYGGKSTYGRKGRLKQDDFADIGAGYDENDSFIDNTDGYDEMIPPECDTLYGGFYINSGSLEFKSVPREQSADMDEPNRRNKRRLSSSSSESSESSSASESDDKEHKPRANGDIHSHDTGHRKKKNKKIDKQQAKKVRRTDSSAATSGKQTSDDNAQGDGESADSRTSQSDSVTSKPTPSSENAITSDSSRDVEAKVEVKLPPAISQVLDSLEANIAKQLMERPSNAKQLFANSQQHLIRLDQIVKKNNVESSISRAAWSRAANLFGISRAKLTHKLKLALEKGKPDNGHKVSEAPATVVSQPAVITTANTTTAVTTNNKRKHHEVEENLDFSGLTDEQREEKIVETLDRLKALIEERKPGMIANYNAECERVQEERKKLQIASGGGAAPVERRLPKRRFPWCGRARALLARLRALAAPPPAAARLLAARALPLFPPGFVRMPTLLRQADLSKEIKVSEIKRQRLGSASQPAAGGGGGGGAARGPPAPPAPQSQPAPPPLPFPEPIQFPSSLTVTATIKPDKDQNDDKFKQNSVFSSIINSYSQNKDLVIEKDKKDNNKEDLYIPPNNIGSITITAVPHNPKEKKPTEKPQQGLIRVKSPAALNEMVNKKDVKAAKKQETKSSSKDKNIEPLHIDTTYQTSKKDPSPKNKEELLSQKLIESMRSAENNIPRPALVPVHHSPTFAKPDKRPPEVKKKKDVTIVSDVDPLSDVPETLAVDDSSSDVEVVEVLDKSDKIEVPSKDKSKTVSVKVPKVKDGKNNEDSKVDEDIDTLLRNIRELEHSQEPKFNNSSYGGVITSAKRQMSSSQANFGREPIFGGRNDKDKFAERTSLNKMDGCKIITG